PRRPGGGHQHVRGRSRGRRAGSGAAHRRPGSAPRGLLPLRRDDRGLAVGRRIRRRRRHLSLPAAPRTARGILLAAGRWAAAAAGQEPAVSPTPAPPERQRKFVGEGPGGKILEIAAGPGSIIGKDELILKEYVDIKYGDTRLQADYVRYLPSTKDVTALGNVILDQGTSRLTAERLTYNLDTETGVFYTARGYAEPSYYFEADRVEKISKDEMVLYDATFTACTQPVPYWSFKIERALIRQDDYAYLHNPRFKIGHVIVFYSPYLIWPVKSDSASGLLFPEFGFSRRSCTILSN